MDTDVKTEGDDRRLNNLVAITVVILTVFMAVSKIKDDNINQAMQKAKAESVDAWAEYQAARIKLHVDENGLSTLRLLETTGRSTRRSPPSRPPNTKPTSRNIRSARRRRGRRPSGSRPNTSGSTSATTSSTCRTPSCRSRSRSPPSRRWSTCTGCCLSPGPSAPWLRHGHCRLRRRFLAAGLAGGAAGDVTRGRYCSKRSMNHLSSRDPDLVLPDLVLDAVLEVGVVVDLDDDEAVVGLLDVDAVEARRRSARAARTAMSITSRGAWSSSKVRKPPSREEPSGRCLTICQWPRAMRYWQTNSGSPASTPTRQSNSVGMNFCASSRSVSSNSSSAMRRNSSGVVDLVDAARERAVRDLHHQRQAELVHRPAAGRRPRRASRSAASAPGSWPSSSIR